MTSNGLHVRSISSAELPAHLDAVAALRITVFRDWPYLYEGDAGYERDYLSVYADSADSVVVLALDDERVVGASTGLPLVDDAPAFRVPFEAAGFDPTEVFYLGESVLLPEYRGRGVGHAFFDHRESHARALGRFATTAFCAVDRTGDDPRRPADHRDNAAFWHGRGYTRRPGLTMQLPWREVGETEERMHALTFWTRALEPGPGTDHAVAAHAAADGMEGGR